MRILSYNIHGCIGRDRREAPERIIDVIRHSNADVVGLQEVHNEDALDRSFLQKLEGLHYQSVSYGKTMRKPEADYGNLLLLREPPENITRIELPAGNGEPRGAIIANTRHKQQPLRIITTHLDIHSSERKRQLRELLKHIPTNTDATNCILMGDLNEWLPIRRYFMQFRKHFDAFSELRTFPVNPALFALDRIALTGNFKEFRFETDDSKLARIASDHRPLICELSL